MDQKEVRGRKIQVQRNLQQPPRPPVERGVRGVSEAPLGGNPQAARQPGKIDYFLAGRYRMTRTFSSVMSPPSTISSRRGRISSIRSVASTISTTMGRSCDSRRILSV